MQYKIVDSLGVRNGMCMEELGDLWFVFDKDEEYQAMFDGCELLRDFNECTHRGINGSVEEAQKAYWYYYEKKKKPRVGGIPGAH